MNMITLDSVGLLKDLQERATKTLIDNDFKDGYLCALQHAIELLREVRS